MKFLENITEGLIIGTGYAGGVAIMIQNINNYYVYYGVGLIVLTSIYKCLINDIKLGSREVEK